MPEEVFENPQPTEPKTSNWPKIILAAVFGLGFLTAAAYAAYWYGTESAKPPASPTDGQPKTQIQVTPTPTPTSTPTPPVRDETADWKTFLSSRCDFSIKIPPGWNAKDIELVPGTDNPNHNYGCIFISAPDYRIVGETREGLGLFISRTTPGAKFKSVVINSVDDYIKAIENILEPPGQAKNVRPKAIGNISGKYFEFGAFENTSNFVFMKNNFIYNISWLQDYTGIYKDGIDQILSTFKFLD